PGARGDIALRARIEGERAGPRAEPQADQAIAGRHGEHKGHIRKAKPKGPWITEVVAKRLATKARESAQISMALWMPATQLSANAGRLAHREPGKQQHIGPGRENGHQPEGGEGNEALWSRHRFRAWRAERGRAACARRPRS